MNLRFWKRPSAPKLEAKISIPEIWSDERGIALRGWILTPGGPPEWLELIADDIAVPVVSWHHVRRSQQNIRSSDQERDADSGPICREACRERC